MSDVGLIEQAVLAIGEFKERPDQRKLYEDIESLLMKYGNTEMGQINVAAVMTDLMDASSDRRKESFMMVRSGTLSSILRRVTW